jgi:hypothetical protein
MIAQLVFILTLFPSDPEPFHPVVDRAGIASLPAAKAQILGELIRLDETTDPPRLTGWTSPRDSLAWEFIAPRAGRYIVVVEYAAPSGSKGATYRVDVADQSRQATAHPTGSPDRFLPQPLKDAVDLPAGPVKLELHALDCPGELVMNLSRIRLVPAEPAP